MHACGPGKTKDDDDGDRNENVRLIYVQQ